MEREMWSAVMKARAMQTVVWGSKEGKNRKGNWVQKSADRAGPEGNHNKSNESYVKEI